MKIKILLLLIICSIGVSAQVNWNAYGESYKIVGSDTLWLTKSNTIPAKNRANYSKYQIDRLFQSSAADGVITAGTISFNSTTSVATFTSPFTYRISGTNYTPTQTTETLAARDATYARIDLITGTTSGTYSHVTGVASPSPSPPSNPVNTVVVAQITRFTDGTDLVIINDKAKYYSIYGGDLFGTPKIKNGYDLEFRSSASIDDPGDIIWRDSLDNEKVRLFSGRVADSGLFVRFGGGVNPYYRLLHTGNAYTKTQSDNLLALKANLSGAGFTGKISAPTVIAGDSTRNVILTITGSSITGGVNFGNNTELDSSYTPKLARNMGIKVVNRGLNGRQLQQVTVSDSTIYSVRNNIPTYKIGYYMAYECQINDVIRDSTTHSVATYTTQLAGVIDAAIAKGYPLDHIIIFNPAYYNPPVGGLYPNYPFVEARHDAYSAAMQSVATAKGVRFYDAYYTFKAAYLLDPTLLSADIVHPTAKGWTWVANDLTTYLSTFISPISFATPVSQTIGTNYVYGDNNVNGNVNSYHNVTALNNITSTRYMQPKLLYAADSTGVVLYRDPTTLNISTRDIQTQDLYKIWGANLGLVGDFNNIVMPGISQYRLTGSTSANPPINNGAQYHIMNFENGSNKNGTGTITQFAIPTAAVSGLNTGLSYRMRISGTWQGWKHIVQTDGVLPATGQIPIGNGTDYIVKSISGDATLASTGALTLATVTAAKGGTGQVSYTVGDILYASTTTALSKLADIATGNVLKSGGVGGAPSYGKVILSTDVSGVLPTANIDTTSAGGIQSKARANASFALKANLTTNTFGGLQQFGLGAQFNSATSARFYNAANTFFTNVLPTTITANRAITLPDASGVIALTSNLSSYVPYTGATSNFDIGAWNLTAGGVTINGALQIKDNWGMYLFNPSSVYSVQVQAPTLTTNRNVYFPDATGTVSLTSDLPISASFSGVGTATTTFTVTIGTTQTNNTYRVNVTPTNVLSAAVFYVTNKTTTTFDVVYLSGLTGTIAFDWSLFKI